MSEGKGQRKWPIPPGFLWSHNDDCYKHPDGRFWNSDTNEIWDPATRQYTNVQTPHEHVRQVDSTSDARTVNNDNAGNVMRHNYRVLSDAEKAQMTQLKDLGAQFVLLCDSVGSSRELSLAKTKAEEAVMWAVKHVTK